MISRNESIIDQLVTRAIRLGADLLEVDYRDGFEEVFVMSAGVGYSIARIASSSQDGSMLREELQRVAKRPLRLMVDGSQYAIRCRVYDSFGEEAFRVELRPVRPKLERTRHRIQQQAQLPLDRERIRQRS